LLVSSGVCRHGSDGNTSACVPRSKTVSSLAVSDWRYGDLCRHMAFLHRL
jgi:hypothetical protein